MTGITPFATRASMRSSRSRWHSWSPIFLKSSGWLRPSGQFERPSDLHGSQPRPQRGSLMRLSEYARSRDNNFTLLRLLAALTVIMFHSWSALGIGGRDFAYDYVGREIAEMALDMLFVTSGFLVTASLFNRGDLTHFLWARALRLF